MIAAIFAACSKRGEGEDEAENAPDRPSSSTPGAAPEDVETIGENTPDLRDLVEEKYELNEHTEGWLNVPVLWIDDVVVFTPESNNYYLRRNFEGERAFHGVLFADRRSVFGDGSREQIGVNTCIYGHALTDDPEHQNYPIFFGPLHDFRNPEIAQEIPYIFFSTKTDYLAYEVFAVFVVNSDSRDVQYNFEPEDPVQFANMVRDEILPRSIYDYGIEIKDDDKFLTLSTCIYYLDDGTSTNYPNTYYRYVVMGRLVNPDEPFREKAQFTVNENPLIDPDGPIASA
ncbi:MAG: class B sortase [Oscillospiraceae bacterium]|nr:class B sortase [Oscillospiraceae bacterium]